MTHEAIRTELEKVATHVTFSHTDERTGQTVWFINDEMQRIAFPSDMDIAAVAPSIISNRILDRMVTIGNRSKTLDKVRLFKRLMIDGKLPLDETLYKKMTYNQLDAIYQSY